MAHRPGSAEMEALCEVDAFSPQQDHRLFVFNALRDRLETECARQADDRSNDVDVVGRVTRSRTNSMSILRWVMGNSARSVAA